MPGVLGVSGDGIHVEIATIWTMALLDRAGNTCGNQHAFGAPGPGGLENKIWSDPNLMPITLAKAPKTLPEAAKKLWVDTFNGAFESSCQGSEKEKDACAARIAWGQVQEKYKKMGDNWVPKKSEVYHDILLTITKASLQPDGSVRWQAVTSDTEPDRADERTSTELFNDWIERATYKTVTDWLPEPPRMPFLGVSHYPALDGFGEAGPTQRMYVDGIRFKADGAFYADNDHPVGKILLDTIKTELALIKRGEVIEKPVRISAAWWDLEHRHEDSDFTFTRQSLIDKCPLCEKGQTADKVYLKGQLDHFAATRVPMNPRTSIELEEKSMAKTTRKQDAATIVGEELAEALDEKAKLVGKSESGEENELPEAMVVRQKDKDKDEDEDPDDEMMMEEEETPPKRKKKAKAAKADTGQEDIEPPAPKADVTRNEDMAAVEHRPLGGATSLDDAEAFLETRRKMGEMHSHWDMFRMVVQNIMTAGDEEIPDKVKAMSGAVKSLGDRIDSLKAGLADAFLIQEAEYTEEGDYEVPVTVTDSENNTTSAGEVPMTVQTQVQETPVATIEAQVKAVLEGAGNRNEKEQAIQSLLNGYTDTVKADLDRVAPPDPTQVMAEALKAALGEVLNPLTEQVGLLTAKMNAQPQAVAQQQPMQTTLSMPVQKSMSPGYQPQPVSDGGNQLPISRQTGKPSLVTAIARRTVGLQ